MSNEALAEYSAYIEELAKQYSLSADEVQELYVKVLEHQGFITRQDLKEWAQSLKQDVDEDVIALEDVFSDDPTDRWDNHILVEEMMSYLTPLEQDIISMRFGLRGSPIFTLEDIGKKYERNYAWAQRQESRAFRKLRSPVVRRHYPLPKIASGRPSMRWDDPWGTGKRIRCSVCGVVEYEDGAPRCPYCHQEYHAVYAPNQEGLAGLNRLAAELRASNLPYVRTIMSFIRDEYVRVLAKHFRDRVMLDAKEKKMFDDAMEYLREAVRDKH